MSAARQPVDRVLPRQQTDWDIRGALNFIFGGPGGGLLAAAALARYEELDARPIETLGLLLVGAGLFSVWLKIGRPWRALYVFRRPSLSWMSREAVVAAILFPVAAAAILTDAAPLYWIAGLLGIAHVYAQARILRANIGIPAWRGAACQYLVVATGLAEGVGLLCVAAAFADVSSVFAYLLALLIAARFVAWRCYISILREAGAPTGTLKAFAALDPGFVWVGHLVPYLLALVAAVGGPSVLLAPAGALVAASGAWFKHVLILRAAFTQGFALPRTPSRGRSAPGAGAQPGWSLPSGRAFCSTLRTGDGAAKIGLDQIRER